MTRKQKKMLLRILLSAILLGCSFLPLPKAATGTLALTAYLVVGYDILLEAGKGIWNRQLFNENFLMSVATIGAVALAFYTGSGDFVEAVAVMLFYQIGEFFQSYAVGKSRRNIQALMDIRPDYANIEQDGKLVQVDPEEVEVGMLILVRPGEKIPLDGIVESGRSSLNTVALTGESVPRDVEPGDSVISGCINLSGLLQVRTTKAFYDSTVSKILELVEESGFRKSRSEQFISRFARVYTPGVCFSALALAVLPPLGNLLLGNSPGWGDWIYRALTFLVISCPCALVISIPLSFFAGIGGAGREGILVKGSNFLEALAQTKTVVFDKTGTLTQGVFRVNGVYPVEMKQEELLELAALAESASSHPISKSLKEAWGGVLDPSRVGAVEEIGGNGVTAWVDGMTVSVGNHKLMDRRGIALPEQEYTGTVVHVAVQGRYAGAIVISDVLKPTAKQAVRQLRKAGVTEVVMLSGDVNGVAQQVAGELGVDQVRSELLPGDKVREVERLLKPGRKLAFVGDGINDAPVLSRADIGIAMGAMGSDAAIEAADVVLMDDDPLKIVKAMKISRKCMWIVRQNIIFALGVKFACLVLGAFGYASMGLAIFADVGVMVIAVCNAIRALYTHKL